MALIFVDPDAAGDASFVIVGGKCYSRLTGSTMTATTLTIDQACDSCAGCPCAPCNDCAATVAPLMDITVEGPSCSGTFTAVDMTIAPGTNFAIYPSSPVGSCPTRDDNVAFICQDDGTYLAILAPEGSVGPQISGYVHLDCIDGKPVGTVSWGDDEWSITATLY